VIAIKVPLSTGSIIGFSVAIAGTLMYSLAMKNESFQEEVKIEMNSN
jgi:ABC-type xylose transport system permease subunit